MSTFAPLSSSANWSSSAFHHALSGTQMALAAAHAQKVTTHSGLFADRRATRSPRPTPRSTSAWATTRTAALCCAYVTLRPPLDDPVDVAARLGQRDQVAHRAHAV